MKLKGKVESCDGRWLKGWALDASLPGRSVPVRVFLQDRLLLEIEPDVFRWDLKSQGPDSGRPGFIVELPDTCNPASGPLHLRFAETGVELENSPVHLAPREEGLWIPFETTDLTGNRVLALAPHPDDESLACGGALILHRESADPVKVVFLTDGRRGDVAGAFEPQEYVALRRREAETACSVLGVNDVEFWDYEDRELARAPEALGRLVELLTDYAPTLVYAPSPLEFHPDHRATARLIWEAAEQVGVDARIAFYDLNRPINVNTLVDISAVFDRKRRACDAYVSQLANHPYSDAVAGLNRYRALTVSRLAEHAEGYYLMETSELRGRTVDWFTVRQFLPMTRAAAQDGPRVSVIVRTKDRPLLLREALSSLLTQTYSQLEVVLVNDGGRDVSEIAAEFERFLPVRRVVHEKSLGRSAAANAGVQASSGKYLLFLDDDDLLYPRHIEKLVGFLEATGERFAYSDCEQARYRWTGAADFVREGAKALFGGLDFDRDHLYWCNYIPFMCALIRRDLAAEVGPFDEALEVLEDWDFFIRCARVTDLQRLPGITALYRVFGEHQHSDYFELIHRKYTDYWSIEKLARSAWPRIEALQCENQSLRSQALERETRAAALERELQRAQDEAQQTATELHSRLAAAEQALSRARLAFTMVTESYSWRLTRLAPDWLRRLLKGVLDLLAKRPGGPKPDASPPPRTASGSKIDDHVVRSYQPGDEHQILALFRRCFGHERGLDHWLWKYRDNPYGNLQISMAFGPDGSLKAHYAGYPCRFVDGRSGEAILACQIGDTMTAPEARGVGRGSTSLVSRVTRDFFARYCEGRVGFNYGFNSGKIQRYYLRLVPGSCFFEAAPFMVRDLEKPLAGTAPAEGYRVSRVEELDDSWNELFDRVAADYRFLLERDRRYVQWRYLDRPDVDYCLYAVENKGRLVGWSVFHQDGDRLIWGDALFDPGHAGAVERLLDHVLCQPEHAPVRRLEGWFSARPRWWRRSVVDLGFEERSEPSDLGMIYKPFLEPDPLARHGSDLYYTMGDGDLF